MTYINDLDLLWHWSLILTASLGCILNNSIDRIYVIDRHQDFLSFRLKYYTSELFFKSKFSGFRSLWATLRLWHRNTACDISRRYFAAFLSVNPLSLLILSNNSPPSMNSITISRRALQIGKQLHKSLKSITLS